MRHFLYPFHSMFTKHNHAYPLNRLKANTTAKSFLFNRKSQPENNPNMINTTEAIPQR